MYTENATSPNANPASVSAADEMLPKEPATVADPLVRAARDPNHIAYLRCLITPHSAFFTEEGFVEMRLKAAQEARRAIVGERLRNRVN